MDPEALACIIIGIFLAALIAWAFIGSLLSSIADSINKLPPSKIIEYQKVTYNGTTVICCYFVPLIKGHLRKWNKIHMKRLHYSTDKYTKPISTSTKCINFEIAVKILKNKESISYHGINFKPIMAYNKINKEEQVIFYCPKLKYKLEGQYLILGNLEECQRKLEDIEKMGIHSKKISFNHFPIKEA